MIHLLEFSAIFVFAFVNVMVWSFVLMASRADDRLDELRFTTKFESDET